MNEKNEMISRILIAVGGSRYSEKAFEYGLYLARKCKCSLLIVHVAAAIEKVTLTLARLSHTFVIMPQRKHE